MRTHIAPEVRGRHSIDRWRRILPLAVLLLYGSGSTVDGFERPEHGVERLEPWPGRVLPSLALESLDGRVVTLAEHRGGPVLVHYFATWCIPCGRELPALAALALRRPAPQLTILAISVAEPDVRVRRFFEASPVPFPVLLDRQRAMARQWAVDVLPTTILLDADLQPRLSVEGEFDWNSQAADAAIRSLTIPITAQPGPKTVQEAMP